MKLFSLLLNWCAIWLAVGMLAALLPIQKWIEWVIGLILKYA